MKRAIIYVRVSTEEQAAEGVSLEAQLAKAREWAEKNGYSVEEQLVYRDAISGKRADNRPGLQGALAAIRKGDALVFYSLSRLARSTKDTIAISERVEKAGADLVSLTEVLLNTTSTGKLLFRLLAILAEFERDLISERTTLAMQHKKRSRSAYCRSVYGWDFVAGRMKINPREQSVIRDMQRLRARGYSLRKIAEELVAKGVATKRGGTWSAATVRRVLLNDLNDREDLVAAA